MLWIFLLTLLANAEPLRVLTYNVRYPNPGDGPDKWETRRDLFIESIRQMKPDLMGRRNCFICRDSTSWNNCRNMHGSA